MKRSNTIEDELDAIRLKLYEQTKDMSPNDFVAFINGSARDALEKQGIKLAGMEPVRIKTLA